MTKISFLVILLSVTASIVLPSCSQGESPVDTGQPAATNQAPVAPYNPNPADNSLGISAPRTFDWSCYDPDMGDTLSYQVVMGAGSYTDTFNLYRTTSFLVSSFIPLSDYTWKVRATDNHGATTTGPVWHFRTN
jgi:hypothetical protein